MSAQSAQTEAEMASVTSMRAFLSAFLAEATEADKRLHEMIHRTRERIYALDLAENAEFIQEHQRFSKTVTGGQLEGEGLTAEEFAERYLLP